MSTLPNDVRISRPRYTARRSTETWPWCAISSSTAPTPAWKIARSTPPRSAGPSTTSTSPWWTTWPASRNSAPDDLQRMAGRPAGPVGDLLAAGNPGCRDDRVTGFRADRREQAELADPHGQLVVLRLEAERAGHAAAARVHLADLGAGDRAQQRHGGGGAGDRLLVTVPVEQDAPARDRGAQDEPAVGNRLGKQLLGQPGGGGDGLGPWITGQDGRVLVAQGQQAGRFGADDRHALARGTGQAGDHELRPRPGLIDQALGQAGPAAAGRGLEPYRPAGHLQQFDGGPCDRGLGEAGEAVSEEDQLARRALGRWPAGMPSRQVLPLELRQRAPCGDAEQALGQQAGRPEIAKEVRQRRGGRPGPVQRADRAEHAGAKRGAMHIVVGGERLGLERGHVDAERALALARLALQAQVQDLVQPLVAEGGPGVSCGEGLHERICPAAGRVLLLAGGHV